MILLIRHAPFKSRTFRVQTYFGQILMPSLIPLAEEGA